MSDTHNLTAFELYAALPEHAQAFHAGFTAGLEYGRQERSRPTAFAPGGVHGSALAYICPRCRQMAVRVTHLPLPGGSTAMCLDGHEWDPFARAAQPRPCPNCGDLVVAPEGYCPQCRDTLPAHD